MSSRVAMTKSGVKGIEQLTSKERTQTLVINHKLVKSPRIRLQENFFNLLKATGLSRKQFAKKYHIDILIIECFAAADDVTLREVTQLANAFDVDIVRLFKKIKSSILI